MKVTADRDDTQFQFQSDTHVYKPTCMLAVLRSKEDLQMHYWNAHTDTTVQIKKKIDGAFWLNLYPLYGLPMLIDARSPRMYTYPKELHITDSGLVVFRHPKNEGVIAPYRHLVVYRFGMGFMNSGVSYDGAKSTSHFGILAFHNGLDYFYHEKRAIGFTANFIGHTLGGYHCEYCATSASNVFALEHRHALGRFYPYYGLQYSIQYYSHWLSATSADSAAVVHVHSEYQSKMLGLSMGLEYKLANFASIGASYYPGFVAVENGMQFRYQHAATFINLNFHIGWFRKHQPKATEKSFPVHVY
ncbi:MAG: hypothetical protein ACKVOR_11055 [Flavobacteriales bacterium]